MKIAFIGIGNMGEPMARNLLRAGHELIIYNRTREKGDALVAAGARMAGSAAEAARGAEIAITMLANDQAVRDVVFGGVLESLGAGAIHISASTISVPLSKQLAEAHAGRGQGYVAAPVLGRPDAAAAQKLWVIAAGLPDEVARARPVLEAVGRGVSVAGERAWQANLVKICCNFLLAAMLEALGEAFALVRKTGIPARQFLETFTEGLFRSPVYASYGALVADQRYEPAGFKMALGLKDVRLALEAAEAEGVPMPLASLVHDHLLEGIARGQGGRDWAAVAEIIAARAGID